MKKLRWRRVGIGSGAALLTLGVAGALAAAAPVTIDFAYNPQGKEADVIKAEVAQFETLHPDIKVNLQNIVSVYSSDWYNKLLARIAAGETLPDLYQMEENKALGLISQGQILPIDDLIQSAGVDLSDIIPGVRSAMQYNGKTYGLPVRSGVDLVYENTSLVNDAGLSLGNDWTLDQFDSAAKKLTQDTNNDGQTDIWGADIHAVGYTFPAWMPLFGAHGVDPKTGAVTLDKPQATEAMQALLDLVNDGAAYSPAHAPKGVWFPDHNVALGIDYSFQIANWRNTAGLDFDILPLPAGPAGKGNIVLPNELMINANSKHVQAAWELMQYLYSPEVQKQFVLQAGLIYPRESFFTSNLYAQTGAQPKNWAALEDAYLASSWYPPLGDLDTVRSIISDAVSDAFSGTPPSEAMAKGAQNLRVELQKNAQ